MRLLIVKPGRKLQSLAAIKGDFHDWIAAPMAPATVRIDCVQVNEGGRLPDPGDYQGVVLTGSSAMITEACDWMTEGAAWLRNAVGRGIPVLGICFGHQWLAHALGGRVDFNPAGVEVGSVSVQNTLAATDDALFGELPQCFHAQLSHRQSVRELPDGAVRLAASAHEPNQAFRFGTNAWGVQFHPEFDADIIAHYIEYYRDILQAEGRDPQQLQQERLETPHAASILLRFAHIAAGN